MTRQQARRFDRWAIDTLGIPAVVLMENAGCSCAELIKDKLSAVTCPKICIFCGTGNNGGDGYVIARHLLNSGFNVAVVVCGDCSRIKDEAKINLDILRRLGQPVRTLDFDSDIAGQVQSLGGGCDMVVDSLFGTGFKGPVGSEYKELIDSINALNKPILAVDIPSGLDCDSGLALGSAVKAAYTVTFGAVKKGLTSPDAAAYCGQVFIASIGVEPSAWPGFSE